MRRAPFVPTVLAAVLAAVPAALPAAAAERRIAELELRSWSAGVTGDALVREAGIGDRIDFERDLGLEDDAAIEGKLTLFPTRNLFVRLAFAPLDLHGDRVVSRTLEFAGQTFDVSTRVVSDLDLESARASVGWLFRAAGDRVRIGPMIGAAGFRGEAMLTAPNQLALLAATAREEFEGAFASAGALLEVAPLSRLELFVEVHQLVGFDEGDVRDLEAGVRFFLIDRLALTAAYRSLAMELEEDDDRLDADIEGPTFGVIARF